MSQLSFLQLTCMTFKYISIFIFCLATVSSIAQNNILLHGRILKKNSHEPVPFVHISLKESSTGTITNIFGEFQFKIPLKYKDGIINFSCIGYSALYIPVNKLKKEETIYLIPSQTLLSEVLIIPKSAESIVRDAIKNIPENYPNNPMISEGFYREEVKNARGEHLYLSEGLIQVHKQSYKNKHQRGYIKIIKGRSKTFPILDSLNTRFYAGAHIAHRFDFVMKKKDFLNIEKMNAFFYKQVGETTHNGNIVYIIMFWPKNKFTGNYKGKVYIEAETGAFLSFECTATAHYIKSMNLIQRAKWKEREYKVHYRLINKKWHLNDVWQKGIYASGKSLGNINYTTEFVATKIDSSAINPIKYVDRLHYQDIFLHKVDTLQSEFWGNNNIIKESYNSATLNNIKNSSNKNQWLFKIGNRISRSYGLSLLTIRPLVSEVKFIYEVPSGSFVKNKVLKGDGFPVLFHYSYSYQFKKHINVGLGFSGDIYGKYKWSENSILLSYQHNLRKENKRPIYIQSKLGFSYYITDIPLGKFKNANSNLKIDNKNFDASEIQIDLRTKNIGVKSAISLLYEINPKLSLSLEAGLYTKISNSSVVKFKEKSGFFLTRKSASLRFTDESISIKANGSPVLELPLKYDYYLSLGVAKKLF